MFKNKGITLIALVITIIILLILAGISIATLTGQNGLLTKTEVAKTETIRKSAEEKVKIAVTGSIGQNGRIDYTDLNANLRQVEGLTDIMYNNKSIMEENKIENLPIQVIVDNNTFEIDEEGNVKRIGAKPQVTHTINPEEQVPEGGKITIYIQATVQVGAITKIIKPDGTIAENVNTTEFVVTENNEYEFIVEGSDGGKTNYIVEITNGKEVERFSDIYETTADYTDKNGNVAKIPAGFAVGKSNSINNIKNGLVITDGIDENHLSTGNQFVWIPVTTGTTYARNTRYEDTRLSGSCYNPSGYLPSGVSLTEEQLVRKAGGFYIARFETGKVGADTPISKKGATVWVSIKPTDCIEKAKTLVNNAFAKSALISGIQWDLTMAFVNGKKDGAGKNFNVTANDTTRFRRNSKLSGSNEADRVCNIYDLESNFSEFIAERTRYNTGTNWKPDYIQRGGDTSMYFAAYRNSTNGDNGVSTISFRMVLYVIL